MKDYCSEIQYDTSDNLLDQLKTLRFSQLVMSHRRLYYALGNSYKMERHI